MSEEKFTLRVPDADALPEDFPDRVEQGNLATDLPRGQVIEISNRRFADWLVRELGLVEVKDDASPKKTGGKK